MSRGLFLVMMLPQSLILIALGFYEPKLSKENVFFNVRVPYDYKNNEELKRVYREYCRNWAAISISLTLAYLYILFFGDLKFTIKLYPSYIILLVFIMMVVSYIAYKKVISIKNKSNWGYSKKNIVVVDLKNRNRTNYPSSKWFAIPIVVFLYTVVLTLIVYPTLPNKIPLHYNINNNVDRWGNKTVFVFIVMFLVQILDIVLMKHLYNVSKISKQKIIAYNPEKSVYQNSLIKRQIGILIVILCTLTQLIFTTIILLMLQILSIKTMTYILVLLMFIISAFVAIVILKIYSIYKRNFEIVEGEKIIDKDDDKYYIAGMFYYNPDDPSLMVEKREGIGWEFNMAKPVAKIIVLFVLILMIVSMVLPLIYE